jgi:hypothetical protein
MQHLAASTGRRLLSVTCCKELQPAAITRAFRAAAATGGWLLLEGLELLPGPALATLSDHLSVLQEAASVDVVEELLSLAGGAGWWCGCKASCMCDRRMQSRAACLRGGLATWHLQLPLLPAFETPRLQLLLDPSCKDVLTRSTLPCPALQAPAAP